MDILKAEIARKRKLLEEKNIIVSKLLQFITSIAFNRSNNTDIYIYYFRILQRIRNTSKGASS